MTCAQILLGTVAVLIAMIGVASAQEEIAWTYQGAESPEHWGELSTEFGACQNVGQQSPINLADTVVVDMPDVEEVAWNPTAEWTVINNSHTIEAKADDAGTLTVDGKEYVLQQFHFHNPSEHAIDDIRSPMEAHFVHKAEDGSFAVIGVMLVGGGGENALFDTIVAAGATKGIETEIGAHDPGIFIPENRHHFRYEGSLTTPPCSETVDWTVMKDPMAISDKAIAAFHAIIPVNSRPLQAVNRRFILSE
jgi:carbonic anhydrase